jgi:AcrR family transcriptional regulator
MVPLTADAPRTRRREILDAALEVFTERGYHRAGIEEIRDRSGASIGSIYHHFGGKEEIAAALYVEGMADYQRSLSETVRATSGAEALVREMVRNHLRWVRANPDLARFLLSTREADVREATDDRLKEMNREMIEAMRDRIAEGGFRPMASQLFYALVIGPAQEFARGWLRTRDGAVMREAERVLPGAAWLAVRA